MLCGRFSWVFPLMLALSLSAILAAPAHTQQLEERVYAILQESAEHGGGDIVQQIATQAGFATTGQLLAAIPHSDVMEAIGAADGGDSAAAAHALARGVTKVLVASGTKTFVVGAGAVGAVPVAAGIAAALLTGMVIDGVRDYRQRSAEEELSQEIEAIRADAAAARSEDQLRIRSLEVERTLLWLQHLRMNHAAWQVRLKEADDRYWNHMDTTLLEKQRTEIMGKMAEVEAEFRERHGRFREDLPRTIWVLERELDKIRSHHKELQPLAHRPEVGAEMRELYRRYLSLNSSVTELKNEIPDFDLEYPTMSIVFLVDCSASMGRSGKIKEAIAAVKQGVDATMWDTEWALISFAACNASVICAFTNNPDRIKAAADSLRTGGDTPLTFAVAKAGTYMARNAFGSRSRLILLADGEDNCKERGTKGPEEAADAFRPMYQVKIDDLPTNRPVIR